MALVLDTGVLVAALDARDHDHARCADLLTSSQEDLVVPAPVLVEVNQLLEARSGLRAWVSLTRRVAEDGYGLFHIAPDVLVRAAALQERYADLRIGFVDAAVFLTCLELGEDKLATLDHRHFSVLRTDDGRALRLLPKLD